MATYNGERFIREQLDSLAAQTRPPDELVVTDDGSTDRTLQILDDFSRNAPFPLKIHRNASRLGWSDNFLRAISLCDGTWLALCDQDDVWSPTKLATVQSHIDNNSADPDVVLWVHSAQVTDELLSPSKIRYPDIRRGRVVFGRQFPIWWSFPGFALVFRADLAALACQFAACRGPDPTDPSILLAHDRYIFQLAKIIGAVGMLSDNLSFYRRHGTTTTSTFCGGNHHVEASMRMSSLIKHAVHVGESESYCRHSTTARNLADICHRSALDSAFLRWRGRLFRAEAEYIAYADWLAARARIYSEPSARRRLRLFWCAVRRPGYIKFYGASWTRGILALLKDGVVALPGADRLHGVMFREDKE